MSVDLLNALDARASDQASPTRSEGGSRGEFPAVLSSTLGDDKGSDANSNASPSGPASASEAGALSAGNGEASPDDSAGKDSEEASTEASELASDTGSEGEEDDSTAEGAALGVAAAFVFARRDAGVGEASVLEDGRLTSLDSADADASHSSRGRDVSSGEFVAEDAGLAGAGGELSRQEAAEVVAAIEGRSAGEGADSHSLAGETIVKGAALAEGAQEMAGAQRSGNDGSALAVEEVTSSRDESSSGSESDGRGDGNDRQASEQALFDRAAEGAQSAGIDPALRQAIASGEAAMRAPDTVAVEGAGVVANPIAGAAIETTTTTTPGVPTPPAASDAISVQTEWLASNGGGTARLLLSPPTLGEIAIQVTLRGGVVNVVMVAHEAAAQSVAEDQADRLAQAFAGRDMRLDNFEVRRGDPQDLANSDLSQFAESGSRDGEEPGDNPAAGAGTQPDGQGATGGAEMTEQLVQPQILSVGPEASVDLRI